MVALIAALVTTLLAVGIHHEALVLGAKWIRSFALRRFRPGLAILVALIAHLLEIALFAGAWWWLCSSGTAHLSVAEPTPSDLFYFSGSTYTSLGYGDILPLGVARIFAVVEGVTGLVLIAWTASFTYVEMQRNWGDLT